MKFMLISDNHDSAVGMRLAGITGVIANDADETIKALNSAVADENIAIVLVTEKLGNMCKEYLDNMRLNSKRPIVVVIPDRHTSEGGCENHILKYVQDSIGIKI